MSDDLLAMYDANPTNQGLLNAVVKFASAQALGNPELGSGRGFVGNPQGLQNYIEGVIANPRQAVQALQEYFNLRSQQDGTEYGLQDYLAETARSGIYSEMVRPSGRTGPLAAEDFSTVRNAVTAISDAFKGTITPEQRDAVLGMQYNVRNPEQLDELKTQYTRNISAAALSNFTAPEGVALSEGSALAAAPAQTGGRALG